MYLCLLQVSVNEWKLSTCLYVIHIHGLSFNAELGEFRVKKLLKKYVPYIDFISIFQTQ